MTIDCAVALLLDLAELDVSSIDEWEAHETLADFKERAFNLLKTWPEKSVQPPVDPIPDTTPEVTSGVIRIEGTQGFWGHSIGLTKDPRLAAPNVNLGLKCNRLPEK